MHVLPVDVVQSSNATSYILLVLRVISSFHIMGADGPESGFIQFAR